MYYLVKNIHVATAVITAALFLLRLALDLWGRPWRQTPLRWLPHVNDTVLLASAITLVVITPWSVVSDYWLSAKIVLLLGYIPAGKQALDQQRGRHSRVAFAIVAILVLAGIFVHALYKPG